MTKRSSLRKQSQSFKKLSEINPQQFASATQLQLFQKAGPSIVQMNLMQSKKVKKKWLDTTTPVFKDGDV